eukprot:9174562-Lingulodinium_polyedra.AAC.1
MVSSLLPPPAQVAWCTCSTPALAWPEKQRERRAMSGPRRASHGTARGLPTAAPQRPGATWTPGGPSSEDPLAR